MSVIAEALDLSEALCKSFEGFSAKPYLCPAGVPTIGYGTVWKPDGNRVTMNHAHISKETASEWLRHELEYNYMLAVLKASPGLIQEPRKLAAVTDFTYNLGSAAYRGSTLRKRVDVGNWAEAKSELGKWVRGGGKVLPGLVRRRQAEAALM